MSQPKSRYRYFERTIADNGVAPLSVYGNFLSLLANTSTTDILVSIDNQQYEKLPQGLSIELPKGDIFTDIFFQNLSGAECTIKFAVSAGRIYDNRLSIFGVMNVTGDMRVVDVSDEIDTPGVFPLNVGNSYTYEVPAVTNQKEILLQNCGIVDVWVGNYQIDPTADRGIKLVPSDSITMAVTCSVWIKSNAADGKISVLRFKKSNG